MPDDRLIESFSERLLSVSACQTLCRVRSLVGESATVPSSGREEQGFLNYSTHQKPQEGSGSRRWLGPPSQLLSQQVGVRSENVHFQQGPRRHRCCWPGDPTVRHTSVKVPIKSPLVSCKAKWKPTALPSPGKWNEMKISLKLLLEGGTRCKASPEAGRRPTGRRGGRGALSSGVAQL